MHKRSPFRACSGKGHRRTYSRTFVQWLEASPPLFELGLGSYGGQSSLCDISQRRLGVWQQGPGPSRGLYPLEHAAEVAPSSPVIACGGGSRRNDTRSGRCLRSAEIMAEFVCDIRWQIFHARRCGYEILKCVSSFSCIIFSSSLKKLLPAQLFVRISPNWYGAGHSSCAVNITCTAPYSTVECGTIYYLPVNFETAASDTIYSTLAFQLKSNTNNSNKAV